MPNATRCSMEHLPPPAGTRLRKIARLYLPGTRLANPRALLGLEAMFVREEGGVRSMESLGHAMMFDNPSGLVKVIAELTT